MFSSNHDMSMAKSNSKSTWSVGEHDSNIAYWNKEQNVDMWHLESQHNTHSYRVTVALIVALWFASRFVVLLLSLLSCGFVF